MACGMKILQNFPVLKNFFEILNFNLYVSQYFLILFCIEDIYYYYNYCNAKATWFCENSKYNRNF